MTTHQEARELARLIDAAYESWERGEAASPSAYDIVLIGERFFGVELSDDRSNLLSDLIYDAGCFGATSRSLADLLIDAFA